MCLQGHLHPPLRLKYPKYFSIAVTPQVARILIETIIRAHSYAIFFTNQLHCDTETSPF